MLDDATLRAFPKISLHDHLDGGLRPRTVCEIAAEIGHRLPAEDPDRLGRWFQESADSGSLVRYLETFDQTIAVMQTADHLRRVAREFVEDLADDGVVYGEARWAPEQHLRAGLTPRTAVLAVRDGLAEGMENCRRLGRPIEVRQLVTAMRHVPEPTTDIAELAVAMRDQGVAGFDIAGAEKGYPPGRFLDSFRLLRDHCGYYTIHAGEADGVGSIRGAVNLCGANRIGHGVAIIEDIDRSGPEPIVGEFAGYVRNEQIPLELCPSSNLQTGAVATLAEHPIALLADLGFAVTVNPDNRLMSGTTMTRELSLLCGQFGWGLDQVRWLTLNAAAAVFAPYETRQALAEHVSAFGVTHSS